MRKLQIRKYKDENEFAHDLYAVSRAVLKNRRVVDSLRDSSVATYDKRKELASTEFPKIVETIRALDDVLPNMARWLDGQSHTDIDGEQLEKLTASVAKVASKSKKMKRAFISTARVFSGQTSKRFRAFSNQVKIHIDAALSGVYDSSDMSVLMMPDRKDNSVVNVAMLSYRGVTDKTGFVYPCFYSYLADTASGIEIRSSPFESLEYVPGEKINSVASAASYLLGRFGNLDIHPVEGDA